MDRARPDPGTHTETLARRVGAFLADALLVVAVPSAVVGTLTDVSGTVGTAAVGGAFLLYAVATEAAFGQTLGKRLFGVVVVGADGSPCDLRAAAIRNVLRVVDGAFAYLVGVAVILLTDDRQRVGDLLADTVVARPE